MAAVTKPSDPDRALRRLRDNDRLHHVHSFTDQVALRRHGPFIVESGQGVWLQGERGIRLLDAMAGLGCVNVGYGVKELAETAAEAMATLGYYHTFSATTHRYAARLAELLAERTPGSLDHVFFANSGSEANETIAKMIMAYWRKRGEAERSIFISRDYGYHGSTIFTATLNGLPHMHAPFGLENDCIVRVRAPYWYRESGDLDPTAFGLQLAHELEERILQIGPEKVAAFFAEPVQATAGAIIPPESYWPAIVRICREHDILLVADEVVSGFGRCGAWFAQDILGFEADFMTVAKGLSSAYQPIAAAIMSDRVAEVLFDRNELFQHGFTTSGHPVACAVAARNIEIIERERLCQRVADQIGPYFRKQMAGLADEPLVGEVRSIGLLAGLEIVRNKADRSHYPLEAGVCAAVSQNALMEGVIVRPTGNSIVICPPLIFDEEHVALTVRALRTALRKTADQIDRMG